MSRTLKLATTAAAAVATVAVTATPALAWTGGSFTGTLAEPMTIKAGSISANCTGSDLAGTITSAGATSITSATFTGCGATVTAQNLPWSGSLSGGTATISSFKVNANVSGVSCTYGGSLTGTYTGSASPVTVTFSNVTVPKTSGSFLCPSSGTVSAKYTLTGSGL